MSTIGRSSPGTCMARERLRAISPGAGAASAIRSEAYSGRLTEIRGRTSSTASGGSSERNRDGSR